MEKVRVLVTNSNKAIVFEVSDFSQYEVLLWIIWISKQLTISNRKPNIYIFT